MNFYDNLVTQAAGFNIFLRPSDEISRARGVLPDSMDPHAENATATALYTKFRQADTIAKDYSAAHNLLSTTTNGFEFLQLIMNQVHPLLAIKNIATIDIPKYSTYRDLYRYAREINGYVANHALKNRAFSDREVSHIFLSHLDSDHFNSAIGKCEAHLQAANVIDTIYLVPALAGTIDQLTKPPSDGNSRNTTRPHQDAHIRALAEYCDDDTVHANDYNEYIDETGETPFIRSFRQGGGRSPFHRTGRGRNSGGRDQGRFGGRGRRPQNKTTFKGSCNSCGMQNHHADSCHFLLKLRQALSYLGIDPNAAFKKKTHYQGRNSYEKNKNFVRSLMAANFIPFKNADEDNFIDVVDGNHDVFLPDIINAIEDADEE